MTTELESISIARSWTRQDEFNCTVRFTGESANVELKLSKEFADRVRELLADEMVAATRDLAMQISRDIIVGKALPAPEELL